MIITDILSLWTTGRAMTRTGRRRGQAGARTGAADKDKGTRAGGGRGGHGRVLFEEPAGAATARTSREVKIRNKALILLHGDS